MMVELLVVPECPHESAAHATLREALDRIGHGGATIHTVVIDSPEAALARNFVGSPSFFIDGRDIFSSTARPAVACRVYRTESGEHGIPSAPAVSGALLAALGVD